MLKVKTLSTDHQNAINIYLSQGVDICPKRYPVDVWSVDDYMMLGLFLKDYPDADVSSLPPPRFGLVHWYATKKFPSLSVDLIPQYDRDKYPLGHMIAMAECPVIDWAKYPPEENSVEMYAKIIVEARAGEILPYLVTDES